MQIPGLQYIPNFITRHEAQELIPKINAAEWLDDLKRRVQHYGFKYDYKKRDIDLSMRLGELPDWAENLAQRIFREGLMPYPADQLIVNEYLPGQGIARHIDCEPCFEDTIVSLSLGSPCVMEFLSKNKAQSYDLLLDPNSLLVMSGEARYDWLHGIRGKKSDVVHGVKIIRKTRISLTFRKIILV